MTTAQARAARLLSRSRATTLKACIQCGNSFRGITVSRYCGKKCRQNAWYANQATGRAAQLARAMQRYGGPQSTPEPSDSTLTRSHSTPEGTP